MSVMVQREERPEGGRLARVTIDNASKLNSLNRALMAEIIEAANALAADPQLRLVVLTVRPDSLLRTLVTARLPLYLAHRSYEGAVGLLGSCS